MDDDAAAGPGRRVNAVAAYEHVLPAAEWRDRRAAHLARLVPWADDRRHRLSRREKHPVYDFLFEYYSFRPAYLTRWSPGAGVLLADARPGDLGWRLDFVEADGGLVLPAAAFPARRLDYLRWAIDYLERVAAREPQFGCLGLHEWAMVYREPRVRHARVPLRLAAGAIDAVVEGHGLRCTHYDAVRFFSEAAAPLNRHALCRKSMPAFDQPGCVHVGMDLYKFAYTVAPFTSGELVADAFGLAREARDLDMRASPYDLRGFGFDPIRLETRDGREEYVARQREIARKAAPIREWVLAEYRRLQRLASGRG